MHTQICCLRFSWAAVLVSFSFGFFFFIFNIVSISIWYATSTSSSAAITATTTTLSALIPTDRMPFDVLRLQERQYVTIFCRFFVRMRMLGFLFSTEYWIIIHTKYTCIVYDIHWNSCKFGTKVFFPSGNHLINWTWARRCFTFKKFKIKVEISAKM